MREGPFLADGFDVTREKTAVRSASPDHELFNAEEMQAIRDQYEERLAAEQAKREDLEWQVRRALAGIQAAQADAERAADQMRKLHQTLAGLIGEVPAVAAVAPSTRTPTPPPAPPRPSYAPRQSYNAYPPRPPVPSSPKPPAPPPAKLSAPSAPVAKSSPHDSGPVPPRPLDGYKRLVA